MKDKAPKFDAEQIAKQEELVSILRGRAIEAIQKSGLDAVFSVFGGEIIGIADAFGLKMSDETRTMTEYLHVTAAAKSFRNLNVRGLEHRAPEWVNFATAAAKEQKKVMTEQERQMISYRNN